MHALAAAAVAVEGCGRVCECVVERGGYFQRPPPSPLCLFEEGAAATLQKSHEPRNSTDTFLTPPLFSRDLIQKN